MTRPLPLQGITVVDLGQIYNGPYCSFLLAMAGARVIKIETPGGEHLRKRSVVAGAALPFAMLNSNKSFATLNLKTERGRDLLRKMVGRADILVENFKVGGLPYFKVEGGVPVTETLKSLHIVPTTGMTATAPPFAELISAARRCTSTGRRRGWPLRGGVVRGTEGPRRGSWRGS